MTAGEMLTFTNRLNEITSSALPADVRFMRLESLKLDIEDSYTNDDFASKLYTTVHEYQEC